ncbi:hypothetical protein ACFYTQ_26245 [Nocardia sp. NPDC004068]|uniref:WXG100-like domain-containing protein n=1 Tax=Nocardia sp. NPDC004068 TaxID=3364303 RepID=UPI0036CFEE2E
MGLDLPPELRWLGYVAGSEWPDGDETAIWQVARAWHDAAAELRSVIPDIEQAKRTAVAAYSAGAGSDSIGEMFDGLIKGESSLESLAGYYDQIGDAAFDMGTQVEAAKLMVIISLAALAIEIAIDWLFPPTAAAAEAADIGVTQAIVRFLSRVIQDRIVASVLRIFGDKFAELAKGWVARILGGMLISAGIDAGVQLGQMAAGHRKNFDATEFGVALAGGAASAGLGKLFGDYLGKQTARWFGDSMANPWVRVGNGALIGGAGGVFGNAVTQVTAGAITGDWSEFGNAYGWTGGAARGVLGGGIRGYRGKFEGPGTKGFEVEALSGRGGAFGKAGGFVSPHDDFAGSPATGPASFGGRETPNVFGGKAIADGEFTGSNSGAHSFASPSANGSRSFDSEDGTRRPTPITTTGDQQAGGGRGNPNNGLGQGNSSNSSTSTVSTGNTGDGSARPPARSSAIDQNANPLTQSTTRPGGDNSSPVTQTGSRVGGENSSPVTQTGSRVGGENSNPLTQAGSRPGGESSNPLTQAGSRPGGEGPVSSSGARSETGAAASNSATAGDSRPASSAGSAAGDASGSRPAATPSRGASGNAAAEPSVSASSKGSTAPAPSTSSTDTRVPIRNPGDGSAPAPAGRPNVGENTTTATGSGGRGSVGENTTTATGSGGRGNLGENLTTTAGSGRGSSDSGPANSGPVHRGPTGSGTPPPVRGVPETPLSGTGGDRSPLVGTGNAPGGRGSLGNSAPPMGGGVRSGSPGDSTAPVAGSGGRGDNAGDTGSIGGRSGSGGNATPDRNDLAPYGSRPPGEHILDGGGLPGLGGRVGGSRGGEEGFTFTRDRDGSLSVRLEDGTEVVVRDGVVFVGLPGRMEGGGGTIAHRYNSDGSVTFPRANGAVTTIETNGGIDHRSGGGVRTRYEPDGTKVVAAPGRPTEVTTPDGTVHLVPTDRQSWAENDGGGFTVTSHDGTRHTVDSDGTIVVTRPGDAQGIRIDAETRAVRFVDADGNPLGTPAGRPGKGAGRFDEQTFGRPDRVTHTVGSDGTVITRGPDGSTTTVKPDGTTEFASPSGETTRFVPGGHRVEFGPDRPTVVTHPDGTSHQVRTDRGSWNANADGELLISSTDGTLHLIKPDEHTVRVGRALDDPHRLSIDTEEKSVRFYGADGRPVKVEVGSDGSVKTTGPDGSTVTVRPDGSASFVSEGGSKTGFGSGGKPSGSKADWNDSAATWQRNDDQVHITSPDGTDFTVDTKNRVVHLTHPGDPRHTVSVDADRNIRFTRPDWTTHTVEPGGIVRTETPDGTVTTVKPDGTTTYEQPNGDVTVSKPDGTVVQTGHDKPVVVSGPDGTVQTLRSDGAVRVTEPDGTTHVIGDSGNPLGGRETTFPDGSTTTVPKSPEGTWWGERLDGARGPSEVVLNRPDGTTLVSDAKGGSKVTDPNGTTYSKDSKGKVTVTPPGAERGSATDAGIGGKGGTVALSNGAILENTSHGFKVFHGDSVSETGRGGVRFTDRQGIIRETRPDGMIAVGNPDGSLRETRSDGTVRITDTDGLSRGSRPDGTTWKVNGDNKVQINEPDGAQPEPVDRASPWVKGSDLTGIFRSRQLPEGDGVPPLGFLPPMAPSETQFIPAELIEQNMPGMPPPPDFPPPPNVPNFQWNPPWSPEWGGGFYGHAPSISPELLAREMAGLRGLAHLDPRLPGLSSALSSALSGLSAAQHAGLSQLAGLSPAALAGLSGLSPAQLAALSGLGGVSPEALAGLSGVSPEALAGLSGVSPEALSALSGLSPEALAGLAGLSPEALAGLAGLPSGALSGLASLAGQPELADLLSQLGGRAGDGLPGSLGSALSSVLPGLSALLSALGVPHGLGAIPGAVDPNSALGQDDSAAVGNDVGEGSDSSGTQWDSAGAGSGSGGSALGDPATARPGDEYGPEAHKSMAATAPGGSGDALSGNGFGEDGGDGAGGDGPRGVGDGGANGHTSQGGGGQPGSQDEHQSLGRDLAGQDHAGRDRAGQDHAGQDSAGRDHAGRDHAGQDYAGQNPAGRDHAGRDHAGQDHAGQDPANRDRAGQDHAGQGGSPSGGGGAPGSPASAGGRAPDASDRKSRKDRKDPARRNRKPPKAIVLKPAEGEEAGVEVPLADVDVMFTMGEDGGAQARSRDKPAPTTETMIREGDPPGV